MSLAIRGNDFNFFFSTNKAKIELVERKWTRKSTLLVKLTSVIWPFWGSKKSFSGLFRTCFGVVQEVFGHCFWPWKAYFWGYFQLERLLNDPENQNFLSKICSFWHFWGVIFDHFGGRKSRFLDFFKVVLELFRKCLGIVFDLKRPTFGGIFSSKGR